MVKALEFDSEGAFVLDCINDSVIVLDLIDTNNVQIRMCNSSFKKLVNIEDPSPIKNHFPFFTPLNSTMFITTLIQCCIGGESIKDVEFTLINREKPVYVSMFSYGKIQTPLNHQYVNCIFRPYFADIAEKLTCLDQIQQYTGIQAGLCECDYDNNDTIHIYGTTSTNQVKGWTDSDSGKRMIQNSLMSKEEVFCILDAAKKVIGTDQYVVLKGSADKIFFNPENESTTEIKKEIFTSSLRFVGYGPTGLPRILYTFDDNRNSTLASYWLNKQKELEDLEYQCNLCKKFFDCVPGMMGMLQTYQDVDGITNANLYFVNPETTKYALTSDRQVNLTPEGRLLWAEKCLESRTSKSPIKFEKKLDQYPLFYSFVVNHIKDDEYVFVGQDITGRIELEEKLRQNQEDLENTVKARTRQLEEALQVKSRFLAIMSHEMRTPLSGITTMTVLLSEAKNLLPEQREMLNIARVCSDQLLLAVTDILDLTQMDEGKLSLDQIPFNLDICMEESLEVVCIEAERKGLELVCNVPNEFTCETFIGDPRRLRQIFINLMANSVKFSTKGEIILSAKALGTAANGKKVLEFSVQDSGIGIPESSKEKLFQAFYQADSTPTRKFGGSGLGLSISKRLAELMGGKMWFESQEGAGTTFYFTAEIQSSQIIPQETDSSHISTLPINVLLLETSPKLSSRLSDHIEYILKATPKVVSFRSAAEILQKDAHDLVILNLNESNYPQVQNLIDLNLNVPMVLLCYTDTLRKHKHLESGRIILLKKPVKESHMYKIFFDLFPNRVSKRTVMRKSNSQDATLPLIQRSLRRSAEMQSILCSEEENPTPVADLSKLSVLIAEDNMINQRVLKRLLENLGINSLVFVPDGVVAIEACTKKKYDLVLMDVMMPRMNGIEAAANIKKNVTTQFQPTHIIALTANALQDNKEKCLAVGMTDVLTKPLQKHELLGKLNDLFSVVVPSV